MAFSFFSSSKPKTVNPNTSITMKDFDIQRFLGLWYEIAHTEGADGSQCNNAIASYTKTQIPGVYQVVNTCYINGDKVDSYVGTLRMPDPNSPARLKVKFEGFFNKEFDYWVYWTDYKSALVGNAKGNFWILSRDTQMGLCVFNSLSQLAIRKSRGSGKKLIHDHLSLKDCEPSDKNSALSIDAVAM